MGWVGWVRDVRECFLGINDTGNGKFGREKQDI